MLGGTRVVGGVGGPLQILKGEPRECGTGLPGNLPLSPPPTLVSHSGTGQLGHHDCCQVGPGVGRGALLLILAS